MLRDISTSESRVGRDIVQSAAAGDQSAWDRIVDAYGPMVWAVPRQCRLSRQEAASVSQLTWMRLSDRLGDLDSETLGDWLQRTAERECSRVIRLSAVSRETEAQIA
jgi:DNA-directed RNA polymerase specialized sigma24 family protein